MVRDCNMLKQDLYNKLFLTREAIKRAGFKANDSLVSLIVVVCSTSVCKVRTKLQQIVAWVFQRILGGSGACLALSQGTARPTSLAHISAVELHMQRTVQAYGAR